MSKYTFLLVVMVSFYGTGQKPLKDFYLKRSLKQDNEQLQFTVLEEDKRGVLFYSKHKFYFWYKAQKVMATQGGSSGNLLHGTFEAFHANKQLSKKGNFKQGLKHGKWMYWRADGTLCRIEQWSHGTQRGEQLFFDEAGMQSEMHHLGRYGSERKVADSLIVSNRNGNKQELTIYDDNKQIIRTECKKNGVYHGKVVYFENGKKVRTERYKNGELLIEEESATKEKAGLRERLKSRKAEGEKAEKKEKTPKPEKEKKEKREKKKKNEEKAQ